MTWWWMLAMMVQTPAAGACGSELADLDRSRALAFATADVDALEGVYVANSALLAADTRSIQQYRERGGRVVGAVLQVSSCRVRSRDDTTVRLEVVDALGPAEVRWDDGSSVRLPTDQPTRRWVTLQMTDDGWRISASQPAPLAG